MSAISIYALLVLLLASQALASKEAEASNSGGQKKRLTRKVLQKQQVLLTDVAVDHAGDTEQMSENKNIDEAAPQDARPTWVAYNQLAEQAEELEKEVNDLQKEKDRRMRIESEALASKEAEASNSGGQKKRLTRKVLPKQQVLLTHVAVDHAGHTEQMSENKNIDEAAPQDARPTWVAYNQLAEQAEELEKEVNDLQKEKDRQNNILRDLKNLNRDLESDARALSRLYYCTWASFCSKGSWLMRKALPSSPSRQPTSPATKDGEALIQGAQNKQLTRKVQKQKALLTDIAVDHAGDTSWMLEDMKISDTAAQASCPNSNGVRGFKFSHNGNWAGAIQMRAGAIQMRAVADEGWCHSDAHCASKCGRWPRCYGFVCEFYGSCFTYWYPLANAKKVRLAISSETPWLTNNAYLNCFFTDSRPTSVAYRELRQKIVQLPAKKPKLEQEISETKHQQSIYREKNTLLEPKRAALAALRRCRWIRNCRDFRYS